MTASTPSTREGELAEVLRPLVGAHADIVANHLTAAGFGPVAEVEAERDAAKMALDDYLSDPPLPIGNDEIATAQELYAAARDSERQAWREAERLRDELAESNESAESAEAAHAELRAGVEALADAITLTAQQVREQGDVRQVVLGDDGVAEGPTLADELWAFGFNLRALLTPDPKETDHERD